MPHQIKVRFFIFIAIYFFILIIPPWSIAGAGTLNRFSISFSGDWANYNMKGMAGTSYYWRQYSTGITFDQTYRERISGGPGFSVEFAYRLTDRFSCGIGAIYLIPRHIDYSLDRYAFWDDYYNWSDQPEIRLIGAKLFAPNIMLGYRLPLKDVTLNFSTKVGWLLGSAEHDQPFELPLGTNGDMRWRFTAKGVGYIFNTGLSHKLTKALYIKSDLGYQFLKTNELKDKDGNKWNGMRLDFSGPFVGAGFEFDL
jgi:hypothetical protein